MTTTRNTFKEKLGTSPCIWIIAIALLMAIGASGLFGQDSVKLTAHASGDPNAVTVKVKEITVLPDQTKTISVSPRAEFTIEIKGKFGVVQRQVWASVGPPEYFEDPILDTPYWHVSTDENGEYVRVDGLIEHYPMGPSNRDYCEPAIGGVTIGGACSLFVFNDESKSWIPSNGVFFSDHSDAPSSEGVPSGEPLECDSSAEFTTTYRVRLTDPNARGPGRGCYETCGGGGGGGGGGGEGGDPEYSESNYQESFGSGTAPIGTPLGPIFLNVPISSSLPLSPSQFIFQPVLALTYTDVTSNGLRVISTPYSRIEIETVGTSLVVRIFDNLSPGANPTHIRTYSRVTDEDLGSGLRLEIEERGETSSYEWFESVSLDRLTKTWKEIRDDVHITFGIATLTLGDGSFTRHVDIAEQFINGDGDIVDVDRTLETYVSTSFGEVLQTSTRGLGVDAVTTSYSYLNNLHFVGLLEYWFDSTGAWEKYVYEIGSGDLTHTLRPWKDLPAGPSQAVFGNSHATVQVSDSTSETWILGTKVSQSNISYPSRRNPEISRGNWNTETNALTNDPNGATTRTVTYNDVADDEENKSTRTVTFSDEIGTKRMDLEVLTGESSYTLISRTDYQYDSQGRLQNVLRDGDLVSFTEYHANGTRTVTGEDGSSVTYSADVPGSENSSQTSHGGGVFPDIVSSNTKVGNTTTQTRSADGLTVSSSSTSTAGGRLLSSTDELGRTTTYTYTTNPSTGQRTETETGPGGLTRITTYHRDGQIKSVTGSGVVPEFYDYTVSNGLLVTTVRLGAPDSPRFRKTHTDGNGRVKKEESPLPGGRTLTRIYHYDTQGRLVRVQRTGLADELTEYDALGRAYRRGLDIDGNGTLDPASSDRIVETERFYENDGDWVDDGGWVANGDCWEISLTSTYLSDGNATKTLLSGTGRRIGLGAESITENRQPGNRTIITTTTVNRAEGTTTVTATANFSSEPAVSIYRYGRLVEQGSFTVAARTKYFYDALGRVTSIEDPRTGLLTEIGLNAAGLQLSITRPDPDGAGPLGPLVTEYGYYPATHPNAGELHWSEDGLGKRTYRAYNTRGQLTHQWGAGTYPLRHLYNTYGDMTGLHTWRAGDPAAWSGVDLPAAFNASAPDITTWVYDEGSGLLVQKKDHSGRGPTYTYRDSGLLETRSWARGIVTTYDWTPAGDLATVSYSDDTPDVTRTYRRDGSLATVTDAAGTTTYAYNGTLASGESIQGGALNGLTLSYPQSQGRRQSFTATLGGDTVSSMGYGYDTYGRLESVTEPGIGTNGFAAVFGYVPNSDLPYTTTSKAGDVNGTPLLTGTRGYDAADRLTSIGYARPGNAIATSHGYVLDAADRRTRADREDGTAWSYGYNDRDEVTSAVKLLPGEELLAGWQQTFDYDNLGNRKSTHEGGNAAGANRRQTVYAANALNQYTQISHPNAFDVLGRAPSDVSVTVNEQPVTRQGEFWRREVGDLPNALAAVWQPVQVDAVDPGAGPNGADVSARRSGHRFVPMASETPFYDFDGNLVTDARWIYVWNAENQLIEMTTAAPALAAGVPRERYRFVYDSRSRRIARTVESWDLDAGAWVVEKNERFVHDDWNVVAVVDAAGEVVQRYAWGNDVSGTPQGAGGVGGLLAATDAASGRSWCYAYDGNGNVSAVVDLSDGAKVGRYDYDAFGRTIATWGDEGLAAANPYRFSTKPLEGTGLYYYGYRWYNAGLGRWLNRDPIEERGGVNLSSFVKNNPTLKTDTLGLDDHHWFTQETGQTPVDKVTKGKCCIKINMYCTEIYGQSNMSWAGSPHEFLHNKMRYQMLYDSALLLGQIDPCAFWVLMDSLQKGSDRLLAEFAMTVGFTRGTHTFSGPELHVYKSGKKGTQTAGWGIVGTKCCDGKSRNSYTHLVRQLEDMIIEEFEQGVIRYKLEPLSLHLPKPSLQPILNPSQYFLPSFQEDNSEEFYWIVVAGALLTPIPGDEVVAAAAATGRMRAVYVQGMKKAVEKTYGPGRSRLPQINFK